MEQVFKFPKKKKFNQWDKTKGDFDENSQEQTERTEDGQIILKNILTEEQNKYLKICKYKDITKNKDDEAGMMTLDF